MTVRPLAMLAFSICPFAIAQTPTPAPQPNAAETSKTAPSPSIEVVVIKPHDPNSTYNDFRFSQDRIAFDNQTVSRLIAFAYAINKQQIVGAPEWIRNSYFDIDGKTNADNPTVPQQQMMMRQILADRFGLRFHRDKRDLSVYALQVARGAPNSRRPRMQAHSPLNNRTATATKPCRPTPATPSLTSSW
jgi:uncharacterized protein (TIGR03435 family)